MMAEMAEKSEMAGEAGVDRVGRVAGWQVDQ